MYRRRDDIGYREYRGQSGSIERSVCNIGGVDGDESRSVAAEIIADNDVGEPGIVQSSDRVGEIVPREPESVGDDISYGDGRWEPGVVEGPGRDTFRDDVIDAIPVASK